MILYDMWGHPEVRRISRGVKKCSMRRECNKQ